MKMGFSSERYPAIAFFIIALTVAQSFGELVILRHPPSEDGQTRKLTCISENDDSALIWNRDYQTTASNSRNEKSDDEVFKPKISEIPTEDGGSQYDSSVHDWLWKSDFDYRWEDFKEFGTNNTREGQGYQYVYQVSGSSGTVTFSARGSRDISVLLCRHKDLTKSPCFRITIGISNGRESTIQTCGSGVPDPHVSSTGESCRELARSSDGTSVIELYEWRTFRIEWNREERTIKVFKSNAEKPFLERKNPTEWQGNFHIFVRNDISSRVRFHSNKYFWTQSDYAKLLTEPFTPQEKVLCIQFWFSTCRECELEIQVIDENQNPILEKFQVANSAGRDSLLQFASVTKTLPRDFEKIRLRIVSYYDGWYKGEKQSWTVDNLRTCDAVGGVRSSTIEIHRENVSGSPTWPKVTCQKLSRHGSTLVDSLSTNIIRNQTIQLQRLIDKWETSCRPPCPSLGEKGSVCTPTGCTCFRGYSGSECAEECTADSGDESCVTVCEDESLLPPHCKKEFERPTVERITDTTARVRQNVELEPGATIRFDILPERTYRPYLAVEAKISGQSMYEADITGLEPQTMFDVHAVISVETGKGIKEFEGPRSHFKTNAIGERCFSVVAMERQLSVHSNSFFEECQSSIWGTCTLKVKGETTKITTVTIPPFPVDFKELTPFTEYKVGIYGNGGKKIWGTTVRTLESAPGAVGYVHKIDPSDKKVTVEWDAPYAKNGIISKYTVSIKRVMLLGCDPNRTPAQNETVKIVRHPIAIFEHLDPYASYTVTVKAHTFTSGPSKYFSFQTKEANIPTSVVSNLRLANNETRLEWDEPEDCTTISGSSKKRKLFFQGISVWAQNWTVENQTTTENYFDLSELHLTPYTTYRVRVHVATEDERLNSTLYREMSWTTDPAAPPSVTSFGIFDADPEENSISLRWEPPYPTYGVLESYLMSISRGGSALQTLTIGALQRCQLWKNYVCLEDVSLPKNVVGKVETKISAKNHNVTDRGAQNSLTFSPDADYNKAPGAPLNLTAINRTRGVVILTWEHPTISHTKIKKFQIDVHVLETDLLKARGTQDPMPINYTVEKKQKEYKTSLYLLPSTKYRFSVKAVNGRNNDSPEEVTDLLIPQSVGFANDMEGQVEFHGTSIDIRFPMIENATEHTRLKVIVEGSSTCTQTESHQRTTPMNVMQWDAAIYEMRTILLLKNGTPPPLTILAEQHQGVTLNCSFNPEDPHTIVLVLEDQDYMKSLEFNAYSNSPASSLAWLIIIPIMAICLLIVFVGYRIRKRVPKLPREPSYLDFFPPSSSPGIARRSSSTSKLPREPSYLELIPPSPETARKSSLTPNLPREPSYLEPISPSAETARRSSSTSLSSPKISVPIPESGENLSSAPLYSSPNQPNSRSVSVEYFEEYAKEATLSGILYSQFELLPRGPRRPCEYGRLPKNLAKNRYRNLIAYDETRVVLKKIPGDPYSDYINASYIRGYNKNEKAYIAAQGPKPNTVNDFWRMIWQEEVRVICMLVNVIEGEKKMCEKYWPDVRTRVKYGDFLVWNADHQVFADYTFRTLNLSYKQDTRKVMHLHYTGWPILGVPTYPQSLVAYLKKLVHTPAGNGPVVVHCNTGDNRTGTIILCDICIRRTSSERMIDVTAETKRLRDSRTNMVGTLQHYVLAHIVIAESLLLLPTQIPCTDDLPDDIKRMKQKLPFDMQRLDDTMWQEEALRSLDTENVADDDLSELLADASEVVYADVLGIGKNRMNAVSVDGVRMKKQYLASRLPSPSTLADFWGFIAESEIKLIIILQSSDPDDPICSDILPDESTVDLVPEIRVRNKTSSDEEEYLTNGEILLTETSEETGKPRSVTVLTFKGWGRKENAKPPNPVALVSLWRASEKIPRKEGQTLVLCRDGIKGCGLYLALSFLLERMAVERECDVVSAIRAVRRSRRAFVQSLEQCEYLYDAAEKYAAYFICYANFT